MLVSIFARWGASPMSGRFTPGLAKAIRCGQTRCVESASEHDMSVAGRNDPCPCGSGKKYKKCCLTRDQALARQSQTAGSPAQLEDHFTAEIRPKLDEAV